MTTNTQKKEKLPKEGTEPIRYRVRTSLLGKIEELGKRSTVVRNIIEKFIIICKLVQQAKEKSEQSGPLRSSSIITIHTHEDTYLLTVKGSGTIATIELDSQEIACHVMELTELLNSTYQPKS